MMTEGLSTGSVSLTTVHQDEHRRNLSTPGLTTGEQMRMKKRFSAAWSRSGSGASAGPPLPYQFRAPPCASDV